MATITMSVAGGSVTATIADAAFSRVLDAAIATRYPDMTRVQVARQILADFIGDLKSQTYAYEQSLNVSPGIPSTIA